MVKHLQELLRQIKELRSEALGIISAVPKILPGKTLDQQGYILLVIREARELFDSGKRDTNKTLDKINELLCHAMVNAELTNMDVEKGGERFRLYPDARGFYSAPSFLSPEFGAFYAFIQGNAKLKTDAANRGAKRALDGLCDQLLEDGQPLPPCVKSFIKATIKVRRLQNG